MSAPFLRRGKAGSCRTELFVCKARHPYRPAEPSTLSAGYVPFHSTIPCLEFEAACTFRGGPTTSTHLRPPPCVPIAVRRFNRRADENVHRTAQAHRAERLEEPWRTRRNVRHARKTGAATSG